MQGRKTTLVYAAIINFSAISGIKKPDPDNGRIYDRLMVSAEKAAELLDWGDVGTAQVMKARDTICQKYGIRYTGKPDEWV